MLLSLLFSCAPEGYDSDPVVLDVSVVEVYAGQGTYFAHEWVDLHVIVANHSDFPGEVLVDADLDGAHIYSKRTTIIEPHSEVDIRLRSKSAGFSDGAFEVKVTVVGEGESDLDVSNNTGLSQPLVFLDD
ncbi:MAG TPA: hypothetical protein QGF58_16900 [Myxococcota bacterium]|nr:hypothetical protein [Myxococcota bacterium]